MFRKIKNQRGFSGLEIVLAMALVVAIIGAGYYVYQSRTKSVASKPVASEVQTLATPVVNTVKFNELGIEMDYEDGAVVDYAIVNDEASLKVYKNLVNVRVNKCAVGSIGQLTQSPGEDFMPSIAKTAKKVGSYYYVYSYEGATPVAGCEGANENSEMSIPAQAFTEAWDSIRAIKK